jgi:hypothetical protein
MFRFLLRTCGFVLLAAAFAALVVDGTRSIAGGRLLQYPLAESVAWLGGARSAAIAADWAQAPGWAGRLAALVFAVPGWIVAAALGLACLSAGRPRNSGDAVSRRGA